MDNEAQELSRIQIRSEEVEAILSYIPRWIIRWGITVLLLVFVMLIAMAAWIEYPDIVYGRAVLTTQSPPMEVVARTSGKLTHFEAVDGKKVNNGKILAVIDNPTTYEAFLKLKEKVAAWEQKKVSTFRNASISSMEGLGSLQTTYAQLLKNITDYQDFTKLQVNKKNKESLEKEIEAFKKLRDDMNKQYNILQEEIDVAKDNMERYETTAKESLTSEEVKGEKRIFWLQQKRRAEEIKMQQQQYNAQIASLETEIVTQSSDNYLRKLQLESNITTILNKLKGELEEWEISYVVKAPISGKAAVLKTTKENKMFTLGEEILTIIPENAGEQIALISLESRGLGKVETTQDVNIKLDGYPHSKYGLLRGKVANIASLSREGIFETEVKLSQGMITTFNDTLKFKQDMTGTAEIITKDATVMQRILEQFLELTQ